MVLTKCCWKMLDLPKVARCIPVLSSRYVGKCAARVLKRSGSSTEHSRLEIIGISGIIHTGVKTDKFARLGAFLTSIIAYLLFNSASYSPLYDRLSLPVTDDCAVRWTSC